MVAIAVVVFEKQWTQKWQQYDPNLDLASLWPSCHRSNKAKSRVVATHTTGGNDDHIQMSLDYTPRVFDYTMYSS